MNLTDSFISCIDDCANRILSKDTVHQIKRCILDYVGVVQAGYKYIGNQLKPIIDKGLDGRCTIIGSGIKTDINTALGVNSFCAHVLELDDGHRIGTPHLEASIITAMIALSQHEKIAYEDFLRGILVGYETTIRLSSSIQPSHKIKGFHSSGTCGSIGVATAIAYALKYNRSEIKGTISAAATGAAGLLMALDDDSELKPFNIANAVKTGFLSAEFGKCGFMGPNDALGGNRGFVQSFAEKCNLAILTEPTERPMIFQIYEKPYAACRHSHAAVDCAIRICEGHKVTPNDIHCIEIETYALAIRGHDHTTVNSSNSAKMSIPYSVAVAIITQSCDIQSFDNSMIVNPMINTLMEKIVIRSNDKMSREYPQKRGSRVTITMNNGDTFSSETDYPLGEPENLLSDQLLERKYDYLTEYSGVLIEKANLQKQYIWYLENHYEDLLQLL